MDFFALRFFGISPRSFFWEASTVRESNASSCLKCVTSSNSFEGGDELRAAREGVGRHCCCFFTPLKINGWNMSSWRFGSDHFPFFSWVMAVGSMLIFQGVSYQIFGLYNLPNITGYITGEIKKMNEHV